LLRFNILPFDMACGSPHIITQSKTESRMMNQQIPVTAETIMKTLGKRKKPYRGWLWFALIAAAGAGVFYYYTLRANQAAEAAPKYETAAISRGNLSVTVTATGTIQPTTQVDLSSELSGTIATVDVNFNSIVKAGSVLAQLDDTKLKAQLTNSEASLAAAEARVEQAKAGLDQAGQLYESAKSLRKSGVSTSNALLTAQVALRQAKSAETIAEADAKLAAANLGIQQADFAKAIIRSPINGVVLKRAVEPGQIVAASLSAPVLFTIAEDLAQMELLVDVDEADIGRVAEGNTAAFTVDAFAGRTFPAVIKSVRFAPEITDGVVTYKAVLAVENKDLSLRPGMTATATINVLNVENALLMPNSALRYSPRAAPEAGTRGSGLLGMIMPPRQRSEPAKASDGKSLWVLRNNTAERVEIVAGESDGTNTAITSDTLKEGDLAVTGEVKTP
jgi:HlyD family secretion protein